MKLHDLIKFSNLSVCVSTSVLLNIRNNMLNTIFFSHGRKHFSSHLRFLHSYYLLLLPRFLNPLLTGTLTLRDWPSWKPKGVFRQGRSGAGRLKPMAEDGRNDRSLCSMMLLENTFTPGGKPLLSQPPAVLCLSSFLGCGSPLPSCWCSVSNSSITCKVYTRLCMQESSWEINVWQLAPYYSHAALPGMD